MKRGKDGDKVTEPMFPRLSAFDAAKGGPRAPPRNKMALYEQLCTPAQRYNGGSKFSSSPGMKPSNLTPPISSKQVGSGNSQHTHIPPSMPTIQSERPENCFSRGMNLNSFPQVELEQGQNVGVKMITQSLLIFDQILTSTVQTVAILKQQNQSLAQRIQTNLRIMWRQHM